MDRAGKPPRQGLSPWGLQRDVSRLFDELWQGFGPGPWRGFGAGGGPGLHGLGFQPRLDVSETADELRIEAELPGIGQGDIELSIAGDRLVLRGEKHRRTQDAAGAVHRVERVYGRFERVVPLPCRVDPDRATAHFENGVLTVRLPKAAGESQRRVRIDVRSG
jgi:HSP20 family molecular chaperone IbpA